MSLSVGTSWVSSQYSRYTVGIWREGPVLYLYMISAESPNSMTFRFGMGRALYLLRISAESPGSMAWGVWAVPVYDFSWVSRQHDVWKRSEGHALCLYMISAESPGNVTLRYGGRVLYCTFIWSQLSFQAAWRLDMAWEACIVPVYDLSLVSMQHGVWIWCEGLALYLYMISAESPGNMTLGTAVRIIVEEKVLSRIMWGSFDHLEQCSSQQRRLLQTDENTWKWLVPSPN